MVESKNIQAVSGKIPGRSLQNSIDIFLCYNKQIFFHGECYVIKELREGYIIDCISGQELKSTPEELEAVQPFALKLVEDYGYPKSNIQTHPQWRVKIRPSDVKKSYPVDIAVFSSEEHSDENLYMIVECKKKTRKDGRSQLEDYMRLSRAVLGVWYNGEETLYIQKHEESGSVTFSEIPNIPLYGQRIEDIGLFKRKDLKKTHNLKSVFASIRNYLAANNTGITLDTEFVSQIINLIFCKIYDERFTKPDDMVGFRAGIKEPAKSVTDRIIDIFEHVKAKYPDVFDKSDVITLSVNSVAYIVGELQQYCLIDSERDVIADAFETFISPSLRGGQGQFFTPRNVIRLIVSLVDPGRKDKIIDPACGSGGFLIESLRYVWQSIQQEGEELGWPDREIFLDQQEVAIKNFRGIDKEKFLSKTTKTYMAILGDGRGGIYCENSLDAPSNWSFQAQNAIGLQTFSVVLTNPPYGSKLKIDDYSILSKYKLGHKWTMKENDASSRQTEKVLSEQTPQILFIERCLSLLIPGGRLGIVVPESMFCNPSHRYVMNYIEQHARIDAIISMPENLFQPYTHAKTCVIMMTKFSEQNVFTDPNHKIFMAVAKWCGHDSRGLEIPYDDIPLIQERYLQFKNGQELSYDHLGFTVRQSEIVNSIYLPIYYNPEIRRQLDSLKCAYDIVTIESLVKAGLLSISTGDEVGKLSYGTGRVPFIRTSDIANWEIKLDPKQGLSEELYDVLSEKQDVKAFDILMVKDGTYLVGTCAMILPSETKIVFQSHLYKIRSNDHNKLDPFLLLALLSAPIVKRQIRSKQFTQDIIDTLGRRIMELELPFPKKEEERKKIIERVKLVFQKRSEAKDIMRSVLLDTVPLDDSYEDNGFMTLV